jgi:hypothetical protein
MTAPPLTDLLRAFAAVTYELAAERDDARDERDDWRRQAEKNQANLTESETIRRGMADELQTLRPGGSDVLAAVAEAVADDLLRDGRAIAKDGGRSPVTADYLFGLAGRLRGALARRDRIEVNP